MSEQQIIFPEKETEELVNFKSALIEIIDLQKEQFKLFQEKLVKIKNEIRIKEDYFRKLTERVEEVEKNYANIDLMEQRIEFIKKEYNENLQELTKLKNDIAAIWKEEQETLYRMSHKKK